MTHPVLRIAATLALLLTVAGWLLPWTVYPDGLSGRTEVWALGRRRTWVVVTMGAVGALVLVCAALAWLRPRSRRSVAVIVGLAALAAAAAVATVITVDFGMVTWSGRGPGGTDIGGADRIGRGVGLWLAAAAPVLALVGALAARISDRTARTPTPATPRAG